MLMDSWCAYANGGAAWWLVPGAYIMGAMSGASCMWLWKERR